MTELVVSVWCQVYERAEYSSTPLLRACGNSTPGEVRSSDNEMYVRMRSDSTRSLRGFKATYTIGDTPTYIIHYLTTYLIIT